jgi:thiosulfate/3-mercaptopyruvate sulfurtransferase
MTGKVPAMQYQFVDCRWDIADIDGGRVLYEGGHVPGASFLDLDRDLSAPAGAAGRHPLPAEDDFAAAAGRAGIGEGVFVVAYGNMGSAERLWWLLRHFGHDDVAVLRGGIDAWAGHLATDCCKVEPREFVPRRREGETIQADELASRLGEDGLVILDARTEARFHGEPSPLDPRPGHIPGARSLPWASEDPVPDDVLAAKEIVVYCGSGVTACVPLMRLAAAGRDDAKLYPGSWSEWAQREELPAEI